MVAQNALRKREENVSKDENLNLRILSMWCRCDLKQIKLQTLRFLN